MPKQGGLGNRMFIDGLDVSGDINSLTEVGGGNTPLDLTSIVQEAMDRKAGIRDGRLAAKSYLNDSVAGTAHLTLAALPYADRVCSYAFGTALKAPVANIISKQANYDASRGKDGGLLFDAQQQGNGFGTEWQELLTAGVRTDVAATNGAAVDFLVATAFGLQAFLHVIEFTGTDATIKIQESSDNGADTYADVVGGAFSLVDSEAYGERIQTTRALAVERYLRVITTTAGGFTSLSFVVSAAKNITEVIFSAV